MIIVEYLNAVDKILTGKDVYRLGQFVGEMRAILDDLDLSEEQLEILKNRTKELE